MRIESRIFNGLAAFFLLAATVYGVWTYYSGPDGLEWIGVVALVLSAGLCGMAGSYFSFVARRIDLRPEDRTNAEVSDGAGDLGFFSPGSYWPLALALSAAVAGLGVVLWQYWVIVPGAVLILLSTGGLLFEYYTGSRAEHERL
jgi:hypothetical protein